MSATIGCESHYEHPDNSADEMRAQIEHEQLDAMKSRKVASETSRYLDHPGELAQDFPADEHGDEVRDLLQKFFEIAQASRTSNRGENDPAQIAYNNAQTVNDLIQLWTSTANQTAEFHN